jgi:hypothetical protein
MRIRQLSLSVCVVLVAVSLAPFALSTPSASAQVTCSGTAEVGISPTIPTTGQSSTIRTTNEVLTDCSNISGTTPATTTASQFTVTSTACGAASTTSNQASKTYTWVDGRPSVVTYTATATPRLGWNYFVIKLTGRVTGGILFYGAAVSETIEGPLPRILDPQCTGAFGGPSKVTVTFG